MNKLIILLTALLFSIQLHAQSNGESDSTSATVSNHQIGLGAGFITGYGASYRYWPKKYGIQLTLAPFFSADDINVSVGATQLVELKKYQHARLFFYQGNHVYIMNEDVYREVPKEELEMNHTPEEPTSEIVTRLNLGTGVGLEVLAGKRISLNFMSGIGYYNVGRPDWSVKLSGELALYFII